MKNVNFDTLKNLEAPEKWIENAINIQNQKAENKVIPFSKFSRTFAMVASLVLVCMVSVAVFLHFDKNLVDVNPNPTPHNDITLSQSKEETDSTNNESTKLIGENTHATETSQGDIISPTEPSENLAETTKPTDSKSDKPTKPATKPTQSQKPTNTTSPTYTNPPTEDPGFDAPIEPSSPQDPESPGNPGAPYDPPAKPSEGEGGKYYVFSTSFSKHTLNNTQQVFCSVKDPDGKLICSYQAATRVSISGNLAYVKFAPPEHLFTKRGMYTCDFYVDSAFICSSIIYI